MTQQQLATAAGIAVSSVAQMEAGDIENPRLNTVKALAKALGAKVMELVENGDQAEPPDPAPAEEPPPEPPRPRGRPRGK